MFSFSVDGEEGIYHGSSEDDYTDFDVEFVADLFFSSKHNLVVNAEYLEGHEGRGTGSTQGVGGFINEVTEYNDASYGAEYTFGAPTSKGRLQFSASVLDRQFDNFLSINADREREETSLKAKLYYSMSETTDLTIELVDSELEYDTGRRDSEETEIFVGVEWQITGKTSGYAKIGVGDKEFDNPEFENNDDDLSWDVGFTWEPKEYSEFTIFTSKEEEETPSTGAFVDTETYGISWGHEWSEKWSTSLSYTNLDQDYVGSLQEDETDIFTGSVTFAFDRWLDFILTYDYSDKSSSVDLLEYDKTKVYLTIDASL